MRQQEKMIQEMERAISKREAIQLSNINLITGKGGKDAAKNTHAGVRKAIAQLKQTLDQNVREARKLDSDIAAQEQQNQLLFEELQV